MEILFNPKDEKVEFASGGQIFKFEPREKKSLPDEVIKHALDNTGLVEYKAEYDKEVLLTDIPYEEMPWKKILTMASARGLVKRVGATKEEYIRLLKESDAHR